MLSNVNLNLLRSLHVLLEECHVSRAAQRLHITQSAVSRQLAQLRDLCGDPLLVRDGNKLVPTNRALLLKGKLDDLLGEFDHLLDDKPFEPQDWQGELVLSSSDYVAQYILPVIVSEVSAEAPNINLAYRLWQPNYLEALNESGIHLASSMFPKKPEQVSSIKLGEDKSVCLMRKSHPLAQQLALSAKDIVNYSHIKVTGGGDKDSYADIALKKQNLKRRVALQVPFFSSAGTVLMQDDYLMIVPEHIAHNLGRHLETTYFSLPFDTEMHTYWLMWHPKYDNDSAHKWAREKAFQAMQKSSYNISMISNHNHDDDL
ncbi:MULTISPECIES: LysR family transcriptional regulator [Vibrio]|uniref:LysR family transcriptional regulator n=1 Tax=Vibrio cyclitrophicus ZF270 TaxID=1136176 RepID=A0AAN0LRW9_9VIBR|nr:MULTISPECIES: LysR family transcriptional regulator [Vibrio]MBE8606310.1 LysR family transcriptional regulator [Vibrio sp. OPT10]OBT23354.1 transcriptional regulator [Vibrio cyclitrophicus]OED90731.1 transcriptional regulator [Vibrio cyclitrophicus ZF30]OEE02487.1 transcriptional regulator [Vibrio cyclitrophicus ZF270]OEE16167.1 transcriptional regulator [Vibrio cyclitrophicus ZF205]